MLMPTMRVLCRLLTCTRSITSSLPGVCCALPRPRTGVCAAHHAPGAAHPALPAYVGSHTAARPVTHCRHEGTCTYGSPVMYRARPRMYAAACAAALQGQAAQRPAPDPQRAARWPGAGAVQQAVRDYQLRRGHARILQRAGPAAAGRLCGPAGPVRAGRKGGHVHGHVHTRTHTHAHTYTHTKHPCTHMQACTPMCADHMVATKVGLYARLSALVHVHTHHSWPPKWDSAVRQAQGSCD